MRNQRHRPQQRPAARSPLQSERPESIDDLRPGLVLLVGRAASVQFAGRAGFAFRVVAVDRTPTYTGWVWLDGYQLDVRGAGVARRRIFVQIAGLRIAVADRPPTARPAAVRANNAQTVKARSGDAALSRQPSRRRE